MRLAFSEINNPDAEHRGIKPSARIKIARAFTQ